MKQLLLALFGCLVLLGCDRSGTSSKEEAETRSEASKDGQRDNSSVNQRDRNVNAKTPMDQNENKLDIGITATIRKSVVDTKMSINAQNVKIITQDGVVTLRGPVKTQDEKNRIEDMARKTAGVKSVVSQLEVESTP